MQTKDHRTISRRGVLKTAGSLLPISFLGLVAPPSLISPAISKELDLTDPDALLRTQVRLRGSLDDRLVYVWLRGKRFALSNGEIKPICGYLGLAITRYRPLDDGSYEFKLYEVSFYTDLETGQPLKRLTMPFTGTTVDVPLYRTGPGTHVVKLENREQLRFDSGKTGRDDDLAAKIAPNASIDYDMKIHPAFSDGEEIWIRVDSFTRMSPDDPAVSGLVYKEAITYRGLRGDIEDTDDPAPPCTMSFAIATSWRPWMSMGDLPGHTITDGIGAKALKLSELPDDVLEFTERYHPDVLDDPAALLTDEA